MTKYKLKGRLKSNIWMIINFNNFFLNFFLELKAALALEKDA